MNAGTKFESPAGHTPRQRPKGRASLLPFGNPKHPELAASGGEFSLNLLAINLTRRCNLNCAHCYLDAKTLKDGSADELTTEEVCTLLDQASKCSDGAMVVLTGGEPLLRPDVEEIVRYGNNLDLTMVVGTNGTMLTKRRVESLKAAGVLGVGISVDSLDPEHHDGFRGAPGSWAKTMAGIENCRQQKLVFQIHFSITANNSAELDDIVEFSRMSGAKVLNLFFLICTGRGESISDISPARYETLLLEIIEAQRRYPDLIIRPRCAPHFKRIAHLQDPSSELNRISGREADGCIAGLHYCRIKPNGGITACPYIPDEVGNVRRQSFSTLWDSASMFKQLREPHLQGNCGVCEYQKLCGGCRARPLAQGGSLMDADPWCRYTPKGTTVIEPLADKVTGIDWSPEAKQRLSRIPGFVRKLVKKRAEAYVMELGEPKVTTEHLAVLSARRFGDAKPKRPGA